MRFVSIASLLWFLASAFAQNLPAEQRTAPDAHGPEDALVAAIASANLDSVAKLLAAGADANQPNSTGRLPLLIAVGNHDDRAVALLLKHGADANRSGKCLEADCPGHPPLVYAAYIAEPAIIRLLLAAGADPSWKTNRAAHYANLNVDVESLRILRAAGKSEPGAASESPGTPAPSGVGLTALVSGLDSSTPTHKPELQLPKSSRGTCRLAVIADDSLAPVADILTAHFAHDQAFAVFERSELDRILQEQSLSHLVAGDSAKAVQVGRILGADALILLKRSTLGDGAIAEMRFVRVHPGLILDTSLAALPLSDPQQWAASIVERVSLLAGKATAPDAAAISILGLRTSLPDAAGGLDRAAGLLLNERLVQAPGIHLLEREAFDSLTREQSFGTAREFWSGAWLLEGNVEPAPDDSRRLSLHVELVPTGGGEKLSFAGTGTRDTLAAVVTDVVRQIVQRLTKRGTTPAPDLQAEARSYFEEAKNASACRMFLEAHRAAETAWLLGLHTAECAQIRVLTGVRTLQWQHSRMGVRGAVPGRNELRGRSWTPRWLNQQLSGQAWLTEGQFIELATECIHTWMQGAPLFESEPLRGSEYFALLHDLIDCAILSLAVFDTAAAELDHGPELANLRESVQVLLNYSEQLASRPGAVSPAAGEVAIARVYLARALSPEPSTAAYLKKLLSTHFKAKDSRTRLEIRCLLCSLGASVQWVPYNFGTSNSPLVMMRLPKGSQLRNDLTKYLLDTALPEDRFLAEFLAFRSGLPASEKRAHSRKIYESIWAMRDFFLSDLEAGGPLWRKLDSLERDPDAEQFAVIDIPMPGTGSSRQVENKDLRVLKLRLTLYALENAPAGTRLPESLFAFYNKTPEESAALAAARAQREQRLPESKSVRNRTPVPINAALSVAQAPSTPASTPPSSASRLAKRAAILGLTSEQQAAFAKIDAEYGILLRFEHDPTPEERQKLMDAAITYRERHLSVLTDAQKALYPPTRLDYIPKATSKDAPALPVSRMWNPLRFSDSQAEYFDLKFGSAAVEGDCLWVYGIFAPFPGERGEQQECIFRIDTPSLQTTKLVLPKRAKSVWEANAQVWLAVSKDRIICGAQNIDLAIYDRKTERWTFNEQVKPAGPPLMVGDECFQITRSVGTDGLIVFNLKTGLADILASTRRSPAASPADDPTLEFQSLSLAQDDLLLFARERQAVAQSPGLNPPPKTPKRSAFKYSLTAKQWQATPPASSLQWPVPDIGDLAAYRADDDRPAFAPTLQDGHTARIPLALEILPELRRWVLPLNKHATVKSFNLPTGMVLTSWPEMALWFLPRAELEAYVSAHPETITSPPRTP